jgi:hypothetical protein
MHSMYNITIQYNAVFTGWDSTTYYPWCL